MTHEQFEAWDEQSLDPQNMPPLSDLSASDLSAIEPRAEQDQDNEDAAAEMTGAADTIKKPVPAGRKARKPRQKAEGAKAKDEAQTTDNSTDEVDELQAQGFTHDEAIRLIHVSDRTANSGEVQEAEAILRRLRFTRWLVERGLLDEWSA